MKYQKLTLGEITLIFIACLLVLSIDGFAFPEYVTQCDPPPTCNNPCEVVRCGSLKPMCVSVPAEDCQSCPTAACVSSDEPEEGPKGWKPEKTPKGWKIGNPHWSW